MYSLPEYLSLVASLLIILLSSPELSFRYRHGSCHGAPSPRQRHGSGNHHALSLGQLKQHSVDPISYLESFGYLPQSETESLRTEEQVSNAIRNLQFKARLNVTGELDEPTRELLIKPRCGVPDVSNNGYRNKRSTLDIQFGHSRVKRFTLQGERWPRTNLTWNLRHSSSSSTLSVDLVRRELSHALDLWARESKLTFREVSPEDRADIEISFYRMFHHDGYPFDGQGQVLAHAFFPGSGRGGDVHFDDDEPWSDERKVDADYASLFSVAVHEFGHSLGLSHSSVEGSLMFPWYSGVPVDERLPQDDREAIQHLYGANDNGWDYEDPRVTETEVESPAAGPTKGIETGTESSGNVPHTTLVPDKCDTKFDAVAIIRSEMWVFRGKYFWRIDKSGGARGDPIMLTSFWYGLPRDIERVDAVYERPDNRIVFFIGRNYYILTGNSHLEAGPLPITRLGLPETLDKIDAAMRWSWNDRTYFFAETMYWRFDESIQHVELDYPRDISVWAGVPYNIDAAFQHSDGKTYFFKDRSFWQFNDVRMRVMNKEPTDVSEHWMHCPKEIKDPFKSGIVATARASTLTSKLRQVIILAALTKLTNSLRW